MKKVLLSVAASASLLTIGMSTAFASTLQDVTMKHSAYVISAPHTGAKRIALEPTGTVLTVESGSNNYWWHVHDPNGHDGYITRDNYYTQASNAPTKISNIANIAYHTSSGTTATVASRSTTTQLPPGVTYDSSIQPVASLNATNQQKFNAILHVAQSKLGTPYIWGHNEDRGQYGFDCSNFTAYVYHHALGYHMSGASQTQYHSVGWTVPKTSMQPGDLLVFNSGGHVGIYIGNGEMIQCGGGLKKVGYLKVSPGSYWYNHLTVVKRMF